jgi:hypothetical protein
MPARLDVETPVLILEVDQSPKRRFHRLLKVTRLTFIALVSALIAVDSFVLIDKKMLRPLTRHLSPSVMVDVSKHNAVGSLEALAAVGVLCAMVSFFRKKRFTRLRGRSSIVRFIVGVISTAALMGTASAATFWIVALTAGSSGQGQGLTVQNISIAASTSAATNLLYPGGNGDVVMTITNPNAAPVTITAVSLPANTVYAPGFTTNTFGTAQTGCSSTTSLVSWNYATGTSGTSHTLTTALTVPASGSLIVTFTNDTSMALTSPLACEATFFQMPSFIGVTATLGAATPTTSPATDAWTS